MVLDNAYLNSVDVYCNKPKRFGASLIVDCGIGFMLGFGGELDGYGSMPLNR